MRFDDSFLRKFFPRPFHLRPTSVFLLIYFLEAESRANIYSREGEKERTRGLFVEQSCSLMRGDRQILEQFLLPRIFRGGNKTRKSDPRDGRSISNYFEIPPFRDLLDTPFPPSAWKTSRVNYPPTRNNVKGRIVC